MMKFTIMACAVLGVAGLAACEKAGEDIDTAIEKVGDGKAKPGDGAFEKAGESIDKAIGIERKDPADSIADAVEDRKSVV